MAEHGSARVLADLPGPHSWPLIGNSLQVDLPRFHLQLEQWAREFGPLYTLRLFGKSILVVGETGLMQEVLQARPDDYRRIGEVESVLKELGTHGLFSAEGASWKTQRKLVMPAFSMRQQRDLYPSISLYTERLRLLWQQAAVRDEAVDVRGDLMRYAVDVTCRVVFGRDLNTLEAPDSDLQSHLSRIFTTVNERVNAPFPYWRWFKLSRDRAVDRSLHAVNQLMSSLIDEARAALDGDPQRMAAPTTLLEAMLVAQRDAEVDERLSDADVTGNVLTLLLAGEDTTSNTLAWMLHYVAHDSAVQAQLRAEIDAVCDESEHVAAYEDIARLRYTAAVAQETLRLRSPAPLNFLETNRDLTVGGVRLPRGSGLFLLTRYGSMDEHNFDNASAFQPQRWLAQAASACPAHQPRAMLAFGGGPRTCPGRSLALLECATVMSMVARNFTLEPMTARDAIHEVFDFTMRPSDLRVRFHARNPLAG